MIPMFSLILNIFIVKDPYVYLDTKYIQSKSSHSFSLQHATPYFLFFGKNKIRQHYSLSVYVSQDNPLPVLRLTTIIRSTSLLPEAQWRRVVKGTPSIVSEAQWRRVVKGRSSIVSEAQWRHVVKGRP